MRARPGAVPAVALLAALTLTVAGCGSDDAANGEGQDPPSAAGGGEPGAASTELPEDFPDAVPLVDGEIRSAGSEAGSWVVLLRVPAAPDPAVDDAVQELTAAGFEERSRSSSQDRSTVMLGDGRWDVMLQSAPDGDGTALTYLVGETTAGRG